MMAFILATDFDFIAYEQNGLFGGGGGGEAFFMPMVFLEYDFNDFCCSV